VQSDLGPTEIVLPVDSNGASIPAERSLPDAVLSRHTDPKQAVLVTVKTGAHRAGIDFSVVSSGAPQLYGVTTYAFPSSRAVHPAFENFSIPKRWLWPVVRGCWPTVRSLRG